MRTSVQDVHQLVGEITPLDELEAKHRTQALRWLESTDDVFRRSKPSTPTPHLVSVGLDHGHTDVSLWFLLIGQRGMPLTTDPAEFSEARWWSPEQIEAADSGTFDPHFPRFVTKLVQ
jgi:hypothetical protein